MNTARWSRGGYARQYNWPQCKYCGRAGESDCKPVECMACGSRVCHGAGSGGGNCPVCIFGWLPSWSRGWLYEDRLCGYKGCEGDAVAQAPRVRRVCKAHLGRATTGYGKTLADYIAARVIERDSGKGSLSMSGWRWVS